MKELKEIKEKLRRQMVKVIEVELDEF